MNLLLIFVSVVLISLSIDDLMRQE
jgi:hypothetical protein